MKKKLVLLFGWNNMLNIGDDIMTCSLFKKYYDKNNYVRIIRTGPFETLDECLNPLPSFSIGMTTLYHIKYIRRKLILINFFLGCVKCDKLVIGGGNILHGKKMLRNFILAIKLAKKINPNLDIIIDNVGLDILTSKGEIKDRNYLLSIAESVTLRDNYSKNIIRININQIFVKIDTAFNFVKNLKIDNKKEEVIGIIPRAGYLNDEVINKIKTYIPVNGTKLLFFQACNSTIKNENDLEIIQDIIDKLNLQHEIISYDGDWKNWLNQLSKCQFIISQRLHGMILADALSIKWLGISYHPKCESYLDMSNSNNGVLI